MYFVICSILASSKPTMKKLCHYVVTKVASKWAFLGYALLDEDKSTKIENIKVDHKIHEMCCIEMFAYWLETHPNANWYGLITALKDAQLQAVAADLEKLFTSMFIATVLQLMTVHIHCILHILTYDFLHIAMYVTTVLHTYV